MGSIDAAVQKEVDRDDGVKRKRPKKKAAKSKTKKKRAKAKAGAAVRGERLDMRLSKAEKSRVTAKAKKLRRTVTSLIIEAIEKIK
jgi:hypothetical protein